MSGKFIQSGNLAGAVESTGTLKANVASQGELNGTLTSEGTLQATVAAEETLHGTMVAEDTLKATIHIPQNVTIESGKTPKIGTVTLLAAAWVGENNLYHQVVDVEGATKNSQIDLTPDVQQLLIFYDKDISFVTENEDGIVTVYCIGQRPTNDYTIQVTITEVVV
jgi:hypothetical protein